MYKFVLEFKIVWRRNFASNFDFDKEMLQRSDQISLKNNSFFRALQLVY